MLIYQIALLSSCHLQLQVGLSQFPNSAQMTILNANFLISVIDNYHAGYSQTQASKKQVSSCTLHITLYYCTTLCHTMSHCLSHPLSHQVTISVILGCAV